jgi:hypothetical protein
MGTVNPRKPPGPYQSIQLDRMSKEEPTQSAVSESGHRINTCSSSRGQETCDGRSEQEYSCDNGEDRGVAQTALGPTMDSIAKADAQQNAKNETQACSSRG